MSAGTKKIDELVRVSDGTPLEARRIVCIEAREKKRSLWIMHTVQLRSWASTLRRWTQWHRDDVELEQSKVLRFV